MLGRYTYTLSTLTPDEEIILVGRLHYFALIIPFFLTAITFISFFFTIIKRRKYFRFDENTRLVDRYIDRSYLCHCFLA